MEAGSNGPERNTEVGKPDDGSDVVVTVERRDNQVTGLRGMGGDFGCLLVADLADADDVRVLTEAVPEQRGKRDVRLDIDFHLADVRNHTLDRVLNGDHVLHRIIDRAEHRIQSGRLAAAGRTAHQDHAGRQLHLRFCL